MKYILFFCLPIIVISLLQNAEAKDSIRSISCTAIREEPGAPTFGFELVRQKAGTYLARYLFYPGDAAQPPHVLVNIEGLKCRFHPAGDSSRMIHLQCQRVGASVESVEIIERKLSVSRDGLRETQFREFRATGVDVPEAHFVNRFGPPDRCEIRR